LAGLGIGPAWPPATGINHTAVMKNSPMAGKTRSVVRNIAGSFGWMV
jgi:hypothetical protein